jgi:hypothetical protein
MTLEPDTIARLTAARDALGAADDEIRANFERIETWLRDLKLGLSVAVAASTAIDGSKLHWGKLDGTWCLWVENGDKQTPLRHTARHVRAEIAVGSLRRLISVLLRVAEGEVQQRGYAIVHARDLVAELGLK